MKPAVQQTLTLMLHIIYATLMSKTFAVLVAYMVTGNT